MTNVTVKHRFAASAECVYDAWFDHEKVRRFLYTTATGEIVRCDIDARVGGRYTIVDRRNGEDELHEGTYLELERPSRIVFTLRVPKFSPNEDRVTIEIEPLTSGCELALTIQTADEWADDTQRGWAMILDVARRGMLGVSALRLVSSPTTLCARGAERSRALACFAADEVASMNGCQNGHVDSTESHAIFL